jgi:hypothetical protein
MRFAAGGAPFAVKRRVVRASSLLKKHPVVFAWRRFHVWWMERVHYGFALPTGPDVHLLTDSIKF